MKTEWHYTLGTTFLIGGLFFVAGMLVQAIWQPIPRKSDK